MTGRPPGTSRLFTGPGRVAGFSEPAETDLVAVLDGLPPSEQRPILAEGDLLERETLIFGKSEQLFRGC